MERDIVDKHTNTVYMLVEGSILHLLIVSKGFKTQMNSPTLNTFAVETSNSGKRSTFPEIFLQIKNPSIKKKKKKKLMLLTTVQ